MLCRGVVNGLRKNCIVFIRVVIIHFYRKSCNSTGVLSLFSEKSCKSAKQDITWKINDMMIEDQWFLEDFWRQYKMRKIRFKTEERSKKGQKLQNLHWSWCPMFPFTSESLGYCLIRPCASLHAPCACVVVRRRFLLVFQADFSRKPLLTFS
jgi:hypothetical protein